MIEIRNRFRAHENFHNNKDLTGPGNERTRREGIAAGSNSGLIRLD